MIRCFFLCLALLAGPAAAQEATLSIGTGPTPFLVRSTTDIVILKPALDAFVAENPELTVNYEQWGSNALYEDSRRACETGAGEADAGFVRIAVRAISGLFRTQFQQFAETFVGPEAMNDLRERAIDVAAKLGAARAHHHEFVPPAQRRYGVEVVNRAEMFTELFHGCRHALVLPCIGLSRMSVVRAQL